MPITSLKKNYRQDVVSVINRSAQPSNGISAVNADAKSLVKNMRIKGKTVVNLLGRMGDCELLDRFSASQSTIALDSTAKYTGNNSIKVTSTVDNAAISLYVASGSYANLVTGKYYVCLAMVKNVDVTSEISINFTSGGTAKKLITSKNKNVFSLVATKFAATANTANLEITAGSSTTGSIAKAQSYNVDSIRLFEVSKSEFDGLDAMSTRQLEEAYPYVEGVKGVFNPYVMNYGKNIAMPLGRGLSYSGIPQVLTDNAVSVDLNNKLLQNIAVQEGFTYSISVNSSNTYGRLNVVFSANSTETVLNEYNSTGIGLLKIEGVTAPIGTKFMTVRILGTDASSKVILSDLMVNLGSKSVNFSPQKTGVMTFLTTLFSEQTTGNNAEEVYEQDGQYFKVSKWKRVEFTGNENWSVSPVTISGAKRIEFSHNLAYTPPIQYLTTVGGRVLNFSIYVDSFGQFYWGDNIVYIVVPNSESGWGEGYTPTKDEIKAYLMGWKMYNGNSDDGNFTSGTKYWRYSNVSVLNSSLSNGNVVSSVPSYRIPNFKPCEIIYQSSTPIVQSVSVDGQLLMHEGINQIEVGSDMIVRERVNGVWDNTDTKAYWHINNKASGLLASLFKYMTEKIISFYENDLPFYKVKVKVEDNAFGNEDAHILGQDINEKATYSVTYKAQSKSPLPIVTFDYGANLNSVVNEIANTVKTTKEKVTILEMKKANTDQSQKSYVNSVDFLNGWKNGNRQKLYYMKDSMGFVHVSGEIKGTQTGTIFILPEGYRPEGDLLFCMKGWDGNSNTTSFVEVPTSGRLGVFAGAFSEVSINLSFYVGV